MVSVTISAQKTQLFFTSNSTAMTFSSLCTGNTSIGLSFRPNLRIRSFCATKINSGFSLKMLFLN